MSRSPFTSKSRPKRCMSSCETGELCQCRWAGIRAWRRVLPPSAVNGSSSVRALAFIGRRSTKTFRSKRFFKGLVPTRAFDRCVAGRPPDNARLTRRCSRRAANGSRASRSALRVRLAAERRSVSQHWHHNMETARLLFGFRRCVVARTRKAGFTATPRVPKAITITSSHDRERTQISRCRADTLERRGRHSD